MTVSMQLLYVLQLLLALTLDFRELPACVGCVHACYHLRRSQSCCAAVLRPVVMFLDLQRGGWLSSSTIVFLALRSPEIKVLV